MKKLLFIFCLVASSGKAIEENKPNLDHLKELKTKDESPYNTINWELIQKSLDNKISTG